MARNITPKKSADINFGELGVFLIAKETEKSFGSFLDNQRAETFCLCYVRACEYFGGVSMKAWIDRLKAVIDIDQKNRMYQSLAALSSTDL